MDTQAKSRAQIARLEAERAELLEALESLDAFANSEEWFGLNGTAVRARISEIARAAIAKAKGRQRSCPNDTNGDGNCGKPLCPHCGKGA